MDLSVEHSTKLGVSFHGGARADLGGQPNEPRSSAASTRSTRSAVARPTRQACRASRSACAVPASAGSQNLLGTGHHHPRVRRRSSTRSRPAATPTCSPRRTSSRPTTSPPRSTSARTSRCRPTSAVGLANLGALAGAAGAPARSARSAASAARRLRRILGAAPGRRHQDQGHPAHQRLERGAPRAHRGDLASAARRSATLGAVSITKRNAQTTVVVHDQQTVVIGGLMRDARRANASRRCPILGDIPVLGLLFRKLDQATRKTNLLLILTPYVIRDQNDLRTVFERKMQERQEFLDRYFVFSDQKHVRAAAATTRAPTACSKTFASRFWRSSERQRLEEDTQAAAIARARAQQPIELRWFPRRGCRSPVAERPLPLPPAWDSPRRPLASRPFNPPRRRGHRPQRQPPHPRRAPLLSRRHPKLLRHSRLRPDRGLRFRLSRRPPPRRKAPLLRAPRLVGGRDRRPVGPSLRRRARSKRAPWRGKAVGREGEISE